MVTKTTMVNASVPEPASSLSRQGSFYGLTLDEVHSQLGDLGKPLCSMNLDELLRTVWTDNDASDPAQLAPGSSLNWQSSLAMPRDLSKKTVEEVWRAIQLGKRSTNDGERSRERQGAYGEMTLEDFLAQAGIAVENDGEVNSIAGSGLGSDPIASQNVLWNQYQMLPQDGTCSMVSMLMPDQDIQQQPITASRGLDGADSAYSDSSMSPSAPMVNPSDTQASGRKRVSRGDFVEKTVERRQRRMIKNRESATRSRLRKQAYTQELELKVSQLEEENERLLKLKEVVEVLPAAPPPEPKYQLRRTSSAPY